MTNGILIVYKEKGYTSHDTVAMVRRIFAQKKVGHTGTLDPDAEGVLAVLLGPSTRISDLLTDQDKTYEACMMLGVKTDTQDLSGAILKTSDKLPSEAALREAICSFLGDSEQIPPMYSALKVNGRKLYELAREGVEVAREPRRIRIKEIEILSVDLPYCRFRVTCSKGTYIRTLCDDIGQKLGCGAAMKSLLRTRTGVFTIDEAVSIAHLREAKEAGTLESFVLPPDRVFMNLVPVHFSAEASHAARNGNFIPFPMTDLSKKNADITQRVRMYDPQNLFYGIYETDPAGAFCRPVKILTDLSAR